MTGYEKNKNVKKTNIKELLKSEKYLIPLYQRNFAWKEPEIKQLLDDIRSNALPNNTNHSNYYLGTLVVSKKENEGFYVITDGQQRFTVLSLINAIIKNFCESKNYISDSNLYFEAREKTRHVIDQLHKDFKTYQKIKEIDTDDIGILNILEAVNIIETYFFENIKPDNYDNFIKYFYKNVLLFRAELPKHTDLNHYFEIMNNRGEQLEMHEILKAAFISKINCLAKEKAFAKIWDACSIMNSHIQMNFDPSERSVLFGEDWTSTQIQGNISKFIEKHIKNEKAENTSDKSKDSNSNSILDIIKYFKIEKVFKQEQIETNKVEFTSIIDFPNFLLQVLSISKEKLEIESTIRLDDKFLLQDFGYPDKLPDSIDFIEQLLRLRVLFDRFVIKRKEEDEDGKDWNWRLRKCINKDNYYEVSIKDDEKRHKTRVLQSMMHVTFTTNNYKNWLQHILKTLDKAENIEEILIDSLKEYVENYYNKNVNENIKFFTLGTHTPRFLFNLLDYILWEKYYDIVQGEKQMPLEYKGIYIEKIFANKDEFINFKFVQRSSVEHLFPQGRINELIGNDDIEKKITLDSFGNLCLVSRSSNSFFGKNMPIQKKNDCKNKNKNESLKQLIMFESFNENAKNDMEKWNKKEIEAHHEEMTNLINTYMNETKTTFNE